MNYNTFLDTKLYIKLQIAYGLEEDNTIIITVIIITIIKHTRRRTT